MLQVLRATFDDWATKALLLAVAIDFVFGVAAAFKTGTFRLSYIAAFLRDDILGKTLPVMSLVLGTKLAQTYEVTIPNFDLKYFANAAAGIALAAFVGSVLSSLRDLGLGAASPAELTGPERPPPA
jgi:hypothetical protein